MPLGTFIDKYVVFLVLYSTPKVTCIVGSFMVQYSTAAFTLENFLNMSVHCTVHD